MQKKPILFTALTIAMALGLKAQDEPINKFRLQSVQVQFGAMEVQNKSASPLTFSNWAPGSDLPQQAVQSFGNMKNFGGHRSGGAHELLFTFGKTPTEKGGMAIQYRIGLMTSSFDMYSYSTSRKTTTPYDTLTSGQNGENTLLDMVNHTDYNFSMHTRQTSIDMNVLLSTNRDARLNFYFGAGLNVGFSWNTVELSRHERVTVESHDNGTYHKRLTDDRDRERFNLDGGFTYSLSVPVGASFNLGKTNKFWSRLAMTAELRPGYNFSTLEQKGLVGSGYVTRSLGVKFKL